MAALHGTLLAGVNRMSDTELKLMFRHLVLGFGMGLLVMLAAGYGASALRGAPAAATTSAQ
jgi:hypothetical protein